MTGGQEADFDRRIATLAELGASTTFAAGTRVLVDEDQSVYISVGQTTDEIGQFLGWQRRTVWIPERARQDMLRKHGVIADPVVASQAILVDPISVHLVDGYPTYRLFFADAALLRDAGLLSSRTTHHVDVIIEMRPVENGSVLRLFHLSPRKKNYGSVQLWP